MTMELKEIVKPLLKWFDQNARILPWRDTPTPYRVWVSEIMLQQTRVEAVKPYYQRFLNALPDVESLANCQEEELLKLWEGLGYYNRVRNMQIAAQTVLQEYQGQLPDDYRKLCSLKGIGEYTAGAIASIAYGIPVPAVDGNVLRVISRVTMNRGDILKQSVKREITSQLQEIIPVDRAGAFNQALMELGACVCVPNGAPHCTECPLRALCMASEQKMTDVIPFKSPSKSRKIENRTVYLIREGNRVALQKRPEKGLLAGMYEFPNVSGFLSQDEVLQDLKSRGLSPIRIQKLNSAKHIFSHIEWHMIAYQISVEETEDMAEYLFVDTKETEEKYPIPAAYSAYTRYLQIRLGTERFKEESNEDFISGNTEL